MTAGLVPVAMMMMGASRSACPREFVDAEVRGIEETGRAR